MATEIPEKDMIEITEKDQKLFDKSIEVCSTLDGRTKTIKHVFNQYIKDGHTLLTIYDVLRLVAHSCIGKIEVTDEGSSNKMNELKEELIINEPEWWKMASLEDETPS